VIAALAVAGPLPLLAGAMPTPPPMR